MCSTQMKLPYQWQPKIVSTHLALIGNVAIAGVPGEFTTMSGRRLRDTVKAAIAETDKSLKDVNVVLAGLCNTYSDYIATPEEYQVVYFFHLNVYTFYIQSSILKKKINKSIPYFII